MKSLKIPENTCQNTGVNMVFTGKLIKGESIFPLIRIGITSAVQFVMNQCVVPFVTLSNTQCRFTIRAPVTCLLALTVTTRDSTFS